MIFNSGTFLVFLLVVYCLYWLLDRRNQNLFLLAASYVFYGWWDWRFLSLIIASSLVDYLVGQGLGRTGTVGARRLLLGLSLAVNLGLLGTFKYFDFFAASFAELAAGLGFAVGPVTLGLVLPVGISFYTFQTLSYTIDVYRGKLAPHRDVVEFFAFVAFFPQLVAGPIERASHLLGQFAAPRRFDQALARDGLRQMLWGLFKKIVVADGLAGYVNQAYADPSAAGGATVLLASYFFAFQIYCDFSGYSDIAIGCARLFGFDLRRNFAYPYFARDIAEFWQRWHISLSTWFRDYVYIPLGGSRVPLTGVIVNTFVTFAVSGLWHGAAWTFVVWGVLNAVYYLPILLRRRAGGQARARSPEPELRDLPRMVWTFHLTLFGWIFFRSESLDHVARVLGTVVGGVDPWVLLRDALWLKLIVASLLLVEWLQRRRPHGLEISHLPTALRWSAYYAVAVTIVFLGTFEYRPFIYFQF